ncbi:hypothetical protein BLNAU_6934 [Blattamonas nauphoetae]|uniref:Uncharacterized protein n=1 Tax=Blattamonas nauphoetae TaxID=2049346 RepID=A0ABQ9Y2P4_9EUKA|nr:hypothetical protein BLNAU_6934 [Blattamonas nauphoetae]
MVQFLEEITPSGPGTTTRFYELVESLKKEVYLTEDLVRQLSSLLEDFKPSNQSAINVAAFVQDLCSSNGHTCQEFIDGIYTLLSSNHPQIAAETTRLLNWASMDVPASTKLRLARANLVDHILSALSQNSTPTWISYLAYHGFLSFLSSLFVRTDQGHRAGQPSYQHSIITSIDIANSGDCVLDHRKDNICHTFVVGMRSHLSNKVKADSQIVVVL